MNAAYTEGDLVQQTMADYLEHQLGWRSAYAYNEDFGPDSLLGRNSEHEVVLKRTLAIVAMMVLGLFKRRVGGA